jgi:hypothetical protein
MSGEKAGDAGCPLSGENPHMADASYLRHDRIRLFLGEP